MPELTVPLTRMDNGDPELMAELLEAVRRVAHSGAFILGAEVESFESEFASFCGTRHAVGVSSGTHALELTLRALAIGPGDEVVVPANSFIATAEAVSLAGAVPVFADVDPRSALVTPASVAAAVSPRTRGIIVVHLYGRTAELEPILEIARTRDLKVIEDACQAHGAWVGDRRAGAAADAGCFSFYPSKNLGGWGDGGAVVSDDAALAERVRRLRSHGESRRYQHDMIGTTARLDALQAAVLRVKLRRLDGWTALRRQLAARLELALSGAAVHTPAPPAPGGDHVFHQYVVETGDRPGLRRHLAAHGVASAVHYPVPIHRTPAYAALAQRSGVLPVAEDRAARICSLPFFPGMTLAEVAQIGAAVQSFVPSDRARD